MFRRLFVTVLPAALVLGGMLFGGTAAANTYGSDGYGSCVYGQGCDHTVVTTPSGLQIAVNLVDHQVIAAGGYDVTITPLNGSGSSFQKVDIYIDDSLVTTVIPGSDGTARWHWDTLQHDGKVIKFVATDQSGQTATQTFNFTISAPQSQPADAGRTGGGSSGKSSGGGIVNSLFVAPVQSIAAAVASFVSGTKSVIQGLPQPVVVAFPWLLFLVLAAEIGYLLGQTRREVKELATVKRLLDQERLIGDLKQGFLMLLSHYLRTPQTILKSGAEGLSADGTAPDVAKSIQQQAAAFGTAIESLIKKINAEDTQLPVSSPAEKLEKMRARQRIIIWLPVVLIGILAAGFIYLAASINKYSPNAFTTLTQLLIYFGLGLGVFYSIRRLRLDRRDRRNTRAVLDEATAAQSRRDEIIDEALLVLNRHINPLQMAVQRLPATSPNAKFVASGLSQLQTITNKFTIASKLKGSRSTGAYHTISLQDLYDRTAEAVDAKARAKNVAVQLDGEVPLHTQNPDLTALVLASLVDNAIAYSPANSTVNLRVTADHGRAEVTVTDTGDGIPEDKLGTLFQPLSKVEGAEVFNHEGMGFSLYLDKLIMTYLGGNIELQSEPAKQTRASFSLPMLG